MPATHPYRGKEDVSVCPHGSFPCSETLCNATVTLNGPDKVQEETCHPLKAVKHWRMKEAGTRVVGVCL